MNKNVGLLLTVYSVVLAGLGFLAHNSAPDFARVTFITCMAGGALCLVWGLLALMGSRRKAWALLTLIPLNFVLLSQTVTGWMAERTAAGQRTATIIVTVTFLLSLGMLMRIAYAGLLASTATTGAGAQPKPNPFSARRP